MIVNENKIKPELLAPVGDLECLKAAVQNGADSVYFGGSLFNARASAHNFDSEELKEAISYAKLRNVKTHLTLNTLLLDSELEEAISLAKYAYECGIDAIIVQDIGLATKLIHLFPSLKIHGSTQMSIHNLEGVLELEKLGFSRVVLSREVPIHEIEYIRKNSSVELEVFIHGALCISYSGQCLFSSTIGRRSGNRGKCAQPCRLPYELLQEDTQTKETNSLGKGYLLSPKDLCSLDYLSSLMQCGIDCFKIEGRMKPPEYVATVTRVYRKYIDQIWDHPDSPITISDEDKKDLLQVFNRGGFSSGHLDSEPNLQLIYPEKPNNMGLYLGNISNYNANKGHISLQINEPLKIGDQITTEKETGKYTISELMIQDKNCKEAPNYSIVKIGRMKGNISIGDKVYKIASKTLSDQAKSAYENSIELKKIPLNCSVRVKENLPIGITINPVTDLLPPDSIYQDIKITIDSDIIPEKAINNPLDMNRILKQINKTNDTPYCFQDIHIYLDEGLFLPSVRTLNELRRSALSKLEETVLTKMKRHVELRNTQETTKTIDKKSITNQNKKMSLLLEYLSPNFDYHLLSNVDRIYIPLKYITNKRYEPIISILKEKADLYIYMPTIVKSNYKNLLLNNLEDVLQRYPMKGFILSNMADIIFLQPYFKKYDCIANYTMNIFNHSSIEELKELGLKEVTLSCELNKEKIEELNHVSSLPTEVIVYGRTILMNMSYCLLGKSNKCYPECSSRCINHCSYYLKDRLGYLFKIVPDNIQTVISLYNSKITSLPSSELTSHSIRISVLDESIEEINAIINTVKQGNRLEGNEYTNGNFYKEL